MASIELDMIQTAGVGALALIVGMILTWYHFFVDYAGALWLVRCGGVVRRYAEGCLYAGILYQRRIPERP